VTSATYTINWLVFITEMKSVYSVARTGSLKKKQSVLRLYRVNTTSLISIHFVQRTKHHLKALYLQHTFFFINISDTGVTGLTTAARLRVKTRQCIVWCHIVAHGMWHCFCGSCVLRNCQPGSFITCRPLVTACARSFFCRLSNLRIHQAYILDIQNSISSDYSVLYLTTLFQCTIIMCINKVKVSLNGWADRVPETGG